MKLLENTVWAYAVMRFADIGKDCNPGSLLRSTFAVCPDSGKAAVDDELFWDMLRRNQCSRRFLERYHIHSLEQLMEDYNEWYAENAYIDHYRHGDERIIYCCE